MSTPADPADQIPPDSEHSAPRKSGLHAVFGNQAIRSAPYDVREPNVGPLTPAEDGTIRIKRETPNGTTYLSFEPAEPPGLSITEFAVIYGVHPGLIPFESRSHDPLRRVMELRRYFETLPKTKATIASSEIAKKGNITGLRSDHAALIPACIYHLAGTRRLIQTRSKHTTRRWINPYYVHLDSVETVAPEERAALLDAFADVGIYKLKDVAPLFGLSYNALERWRDRNDYPWRERRNAGRARIARTAAVTAAISDHTYRSIAEALCMPKTTLTNWRAEFAHGSEYTTPNYDPINTTE